MWGQSNIKVSFSFPILLFLKDTRRIAPGVFLFLLQITNGLIIVWTNKLLSIHPYLNIEIVYSEAKKCIHIIMSPLVIMETATGIVFGWSPPAKLNLFLQEFNLEDIKIYRARLFLKRWIFIETVSLDLHNHRWLELSYLEKIKHVIAFL